MDSAAAAPPPSTRRVLAAESPVPGEIGGVAGLVSPAPPAGLATTPRPREVSGETVPLLSLTPWGDWPGSKRERVTEVALPANTNQGVHPRVPHGRISPVTVVVTAGEICGVEDRCSGSSPRSSHTGVAVDRTEAVPGSQARRNGGAQWGATGSGAVAVDHGSRSLPRSHRTGETVDRPEAVPGARARREPDVPRSTDRPAATVVVGNRTGNGNRPVAVARATPRREAPQGRGARRGKWWHSLGECGCTKGENCS